MEDKSIRVYNTSISEENKLNPSDSISIALNTDLTLAFETSYDSLAVVSQFGNIELQYSAHNVYKCIPKNIGIDNIVVVAFENDEISDGYVIIPIRIKGFSCAYTVISNTDTINTASSQTQYKIKENIETEWFPLNFSTITFSFADRGNGTYTYTPLQGSSITGTFKADNLDNGKDSINYTILYKEQQALMSVKQKKDEKSRYLLTQDRTNYFKNKYPSDDIQKVIMQSYAVRTVR